MFFFVKTLLTANIQFYIFDFFPSLLSSSSLSAQQHVVEDSGSAQYAAWMNVVLSLCAIKADQCHTSSVHKRIVLQVSICVFYHCATCIYSTSLAFILNDVFSITS